MHLSGAYKSALANPHMPVLHHVGALMPSNSACISPHGGVPPSCAPLGLDVCTTMGIGGAYRIFFFIGGRGGIWMVVHSYELSDVGSGDSEH